MEEHVAEFARLAASTPQAAVASQQPVTAQPEAVQYGNSSYSSENGNANRPVQYSDDILQSSN